MEKFKVAIIIPSKNEEKTIFDVVKRAKKIGTPIVIDDNSNDKTEEIKFDKNIIYIRNKINLGYEKSIQIGFEAAERNKYKYLITLDADGQHDTNDISKIINLLNKGNYLVIGERAQLQRVSEYFFSFFYSLFYNIRDPLSGLKGYNIELFKVNNNIFDNNTLIGTELLITCIKKKYKLAKFSINTYPRKDNPRYGNIFKSNFKIFRALLLNILYLLK